MSIFSAIKNAIFGHKAEAAPVAAADTPAIPLTAEAAPVAPVEVDVEAVVGAMAGDSDLNWQSSIVDLMKVLKIDSSLSNREELAKELGYTGELNGSAEMNIWLHKATMQKLAENGGKVPATMLA